MSQAKVDRYKESKKHRKQEVVKQRRNSLIAKIVVPIVAIAIVCWIGYSGYSYVQENKETTTYEVNDSAMTDFMDSVTETAE